MDVDGYTINIEDKDYYPMMKQSYGFTKDESDLILKAYNLLIGQAGHTRQEQIYYVFSNLAALCDEYSGEADRWKFTIGLPSTADAKKHLEKLGMSRRDVDNLHKAINSQHRTPNIDSTSKDFAHELIQYAMFSANSFTHNALDGVIGDLDALGSYRGDVYSTRMGIDDKNSDLDARNIYNKMISGNESLFAKAAQLLRSTVSPPFKTDISSFSPPLF